MNIFRLIGDMSHLGAILILLIKIWTSRSSSGLSVKTQILFFLVFLTRYLDLFYVYISLYNTIMKLTFIVLIAVTLYSMIIKFPHSNTPNDDTLRLEFLIVPVAGLAVLVNHKLIVLEILWTFSIYLESVAILPQLFMISKTGEAETITSHYLFALGTYRALYIVNWIYRYQTEGFYDLIAIVAGCVQTAFFLDFFYLYMTKVLKGKSLTLPTVHC